jgi:signal transduction histidine kinase
VFIDAEGHVLALPDAGSGRSVTVVEREGQPVAVLVHDPAVLADPGLLEAVTAAARLAASNARLRAEVQARVEELAASRRRILEAGDEERRRLERRLHDGAEAWLGELAVTLRRGRGSAAGEQTREQIARAEDQLGRTREELRRLAQGLHPRVLAEHGLASALAVLARDLPLPVEIEVTGNQLPERVAAAAYFVCAEALTNTAKHAAASLATVAVTASDGRVRIEVADDGVGWADPERGSGLRGLADRVETLGGTLQVDSVPGRGTHLAAEIPLSGEVS